MAQAFQARFIQEGLSIDHTPGSNVSAGDVVVVGARALIAKLAIAANALGALATSGLFDVVKAQEQIADGTAVYWDANGNPYNGVAGTGCLTATSSGNTFMGWTVGAAAETDEVARINLSGVPSQTILGGTATAIADPGDGGAIPVSASGSCQLVTEGAETRTLADPTAVGQWLNLSFKTDGGDCVITTASPVNQTGNNTLTFADVGDHLLLIASQDGADIEWRVVANDGVALSTV